jgi:TatA/E family protein of Tat protein translocase
MGTGHFMLPISDFLILTILALLIFGPRRLPEIGRIVGKGLAEFRKASNELRRSISAELAVEEEEKGAKAPDLGPRPLRWVSPLDSGPSSSEPKSEQAGPPGASS